VSLLLPGGCSPPPLLPGLSHSPRCLPLLQAVTDTTGREDLLQHLRGMLLLQLGAQLRCNKVVTGDTATAMAIRVIAETAKVRMGAASSKPHALLQTHALPRCMTAGVPSQS
jgi:hypothetical protein